MPKFSIIIPVCGNEKLTEDCLKSIVENSSDFEVIIVDNGSTPVFKFPDGFSYYAIGPTDKIIRNEKNLGFPVAVNQGIKAATGEVIIILNNDTIVTPHWLELFEQHLKTFDMVGPVSNNVSGPQKIPFELKGLNPTVESFALDNSILKHGQNYPWHRLVFFCVAIKREVIDKVGLLDEQFSPGNFEDDDYCLRAIEAGFKLGIAEDVFIYHICSATHKSENIAYKQLLKTNLAKFMAKWPEWKYKRLQKKCLENCQPASTEKKPSLALCMIVKNEEKGIERAILSCLDFVDEIVISIDTQSTDETETIARRYADVVKFHHFEDDYSAARNSCHQGVKSDFILFLDGHEYVKDYPKLAEHLAIDCEGLLCTVEMENGMKFRNPRIYKNGMQFENPIHELQKMTKIYPYPEFIVQHDRAGGQNLSAVLERNAQRKDQVTNIIGAQFEKNPQDIRAAFHLGLFYAGSGAHRQAIHYFNRYLKYSKNKNERWYVFFNRALCQLALNRCFRAYWSASRADDEIADRWEIAKLKGLIFYQRRKFAKAIEAFVASFKINLGDESYKPWKRDETGTWNLIGECFYNLGNYFKSSTAFSRASDLATDEKFKELLKKRADLMLAMAKNSN